MANLEQQFQMLSTEELMKVEGGVVFATVVIGGVVVKVTGSVIVASLGTAYGTGYAIGRGLGYF